MPAQIMKKRVHGFVGRNFMHRVNTWSWKLYLKWFLTQKINLKNTMYNQ